MGYRRWVSACFLFLSLFAVPAFALEGPVTVVPTGLGYSIWLPGKLSSERQKDALSETQRFHQAWTLFFGQVPPMPDPLVVPAGAEPNEGLFSVLWENASKELDPASRPAALGAFRAEVLDDLSPYVDALARPALSGHLGADLAANSLLYRYMKESIQDPEFLPEALPPGEGAAKLKAALADRGVPWQEFLNRYAAWVIERCIEARLLAPPAGTLPAIWVLDGDLSPGELSLWQFTLAEGDEGVDLQLAGPAPKGLLLFSFFTNEAGLVTRAGLSDLQGGRMLLPRAGKTLWLALWNTSVEAKGAGLTVTLWKDLQPPFVVRRASLSDSICDLLLEEGPGIADYGLSSRLASNEEFLPLPAPRIASEGEGEHLYHVRLSAAVPEASELRVGCRTQAGGFYTADVRLSEPLPP